MVGKHCLYLVLSYRHADVEHTMSVCLDNIALAVHYCYAVHVERHALYGYVATLVGNLTRYLERRLVGEVDGVALCLCVDEAQLLGRLKLVDAECRHNHICSSVAGIRQGTYLVRTVYQGVAAITKLCKSWNVRRTEHCISCHTMVHVMLGTLVRDVVESIVYRIVEGVVGLQAFLVADKVAIVVAFDGLGVERLVPNAHLVNGSLEART